MSSGKTAPSRTAEARLLTRVLDEAYGSGAWHGPDLKAALGDVAPEVAFWRPSPERHNLAEVAFHHTFCARSVRGQLRSEEHTSELQSRGHLVCRLLLEKKKESCW